MTKNQEQIFAAVRNGEDFFAMPLRAVDYARVSTGSPAQLESCRSQRETYAGLIAQNPHWTYAGSYCDEGVTGTKAYLRGGFRQMVADAAKDRFDLVIVKDISRFARNIKECLVYIDELKSCGVMVYFWRERFNTFRPQDEMSLKFMALGAEMEARAARERTRIVFEQGIQKGRVYGNSRILGYRKEHCRLVVVEEEAAVVRRIFELYVYRRWGAQRIARELALCGLTRRDGAPVSPRSVQTILQNPKYKGWYCGGKSELCDLGERYRRRERPPAQWVQYRDPAVPALVSEELWDAAAALRAARRAQYDCCMPAPRARGAYRYSGKLESEAAGARYTRVLYRYKGTVREGWQCRVRGAAAHTACCPTLYSDELDAIVRAVLAALPGGPEAMAAPLLACYRAAADPVPADPGAAQRTQRQVVACRARLLDLYLNGTIPRAEFAARDRAYRARLQAPDSEPDAPAALPADLAARAAAAAQDLEPDRAVIDALVDTMLVLRDSTRTHICLELHLKGVSAALRFAWERRRAGTGEAAFFCTTGRTPN